MGPTTCGGRAAGPPSASPLAASAAGPLCRLTGHGQDRGPAADMPVTATRSGSRRRATVDPLMRREPDADRDAKHALRSAPSCPCWCEVMELTVLVSSAVRTFSTNSRPARRAAASGGRPRAGSDTTGTGEPAPPSHQVTPPPPPPEAHRPCQRLPGLPDSKREPHQPSTPASPTTTGNRPDQHVAPAGPLRLLPGPHHHRRRHRVDRTGPNQPGAPDHRAAAAWQWGRGNRLGDGPPRSTAPQLTRSVRPIAATPATRPSGRERPAREYPQPRSGIGTLVRAGSAPHRQSAVFGGHQRSRRACHNPKSKAIHAEDLGR